MSTDTDIPKRLVAARRRLGWSRETLAYHSGVSWSAITQIEVGRRTNPRPGTLTSLARALGVTIGYLVGEGHSTLLAHRALIYGSDEEFLETVAPFVLEGAERSEAVLVVSSSENLDLLETRLGSGASGVALKDSGDWYGTPLETVTAFRLFADEIVAEGILWIRIVGEPVWANRSEDEIRLWTTYESLFNLVFAALPLTVMCPYDSRSTDESILRIAAATHPDLIRGTEPERNEAYLDPARFLLQGLSSEPTPRASS